MANLIERQITLEGQRNVVVKWVGVLDTANFTLIPALALSECLNNLPGNRLVGFRIDKAQWAISDGLQVIATWASASPQLIAAFSGANHLCAEDVGGWNPDRARAGFTGAINLASAGYSPGSAASFTLTLDLVKRYG